MTDPTSAGMADRPPDRVSFGPWEIDPDDSEPVEDFVPRWRAARFPLPEEIDKFTDEQFLAFIRAIGFEARIEAALAEVKAERALAATDSRRSTETGE